MLADDHPKGMLGPAVALDDHRDGGQHAGLILPARLAGRHLAELAGLTFRWPAPGPGGAPVARRAPTGWRQGDDGRFNLCRRAHRRRRLVAHQRPAPWQIGCVVKAAATLGEPFWRGEGPSSEGLGGHHLLARADARRPAGEPGCGPSPAPSARTPHLAAKRPEGRWFSPTPYLRSRMAFSISAWRRWSASSSSGARHPATLAAGLSRRW